MPPISEGKRRRLKTLSTPAGIIGALAIDQRKSLRGMIAEARSVPLEEISDSCLADFKAAVTAVLTPHTSAVLLDTEYGLEAADLRAKECGLLLAYEMDGYENPRPHRMLALMPGLSVRRLRDIGAQGVKILLHYAPDDKPAANEEKQAWIERIGNECAALEMPFLLEPVVYDPGGLDPRSIDFARMKPKLVIQTIEEFSKDFYRVDILKVEFPVITAFVEGSAVYSGQKAYPMEEALECFQMADAAARRPYIYLSAGVSSAEFLESLRLAVRAGARFSGVLCGRANWQGGVKAYARSSAVAGGAFDKGALYDWLKTSGVQNIQQINCILAAAASWETR